MRQRIRQCEIVRIGHRESRRHAVVISGDAMNEGGLHLIAPLVSPRQQPYPFEVAIEDGTLMTVIGVRAEVGYALAPTGLHVGRDKLDRFLQVLKDVCEL